MIYLLADAFPTVESIVGAAVLAVVMAFLYFLRGERMERKSSAENFTAALERTQDKFAETLREQRTDCEKSCAEQRKLDREHWQTIFGTLNDRLQRGAS